MQQSRASGLKLEITGDVTQFNENDLSVQQLIFPALFAAIIIYFIQIRHTEDFPPTGTPASTSKMLNMSGKTCFYYY